jgi:hypothetical protein
VNSPAPTEFEIMHPALDLSGAVTMRWKDMPDDSFYEIWRGVGSQDPSLYATVPGTSQQYTNAYLNNGQKYYYKIRYKDINGSFSTFTSTVGHVVGWRMAYKSEYLEKLYMNETCWKDISWGRQQIIIYVQVVKYNFEEGKVEYPKQSMGDVSRYSQEDKWRTYNKLLFLWDMTKNASNYWIYFYEEDGGTPIKVTVGAKIWVGNPQDSGTGVGGEVSANIEFSVGGRDDRFGFYEVYNHTLTRMSNGIDIQPAKGEARVIINSY